MEIKKKTYKTKKVNIVKLSIFYNQSKVSQEKAEKNDK
tara:strand:- start:466 stop:579 length:114 start_codon:yes stop_codon:yes gene_type:complete